MTEEEKKQAHSLEKYFWMITEDKYDKLREINGCETLTDLPATVPDGVHVMQLAKNLRIPEENYFIDISPTQADLKKSYMAIMKMSRKKSAEHIPHVIFVYIGGHGATQNEKQIYLLNEAYSNKAMFQIEFKLRYLVQDALSMARLFAVFDCCRVPISNMPGLATGRGVGGQEDEEPPSDEDMPNKYFQI